MIGIELKDKKRPSTTEHTEFTTLLGEPNESPGQILTLGRPMNHQSESIRRNQHDCEDYQIKIILVSIALIVFVLVGLSPFKKYKQDRRGSNLSELIRESKTRHLNQQHNPLKTTKMGVVFLLDRATQFKICDSISIHYDGKEEDTNLKDINQVRILSKKQKSVWIMLDSSLLRKYKFLENPSSVKNLMLCLKDGERKRPDAFFNLQIDLQNYIETKNRGRLILVSLQLNLMELYGRNRLSGSQLRTKSEKDAALLSLVGQGELERPLKIENLRASLLIKPNGFKVNTLEPKYPPIKSNSRLILAIHRVKLNPDCEKDKSCIASSIFYTHHKFSKIQKITVFYKEPDLFNIESWGGQEKNHGNSAGQVVHGDYSETDILYFYLDRQKFKIDSHDGKPIVQLYLKIADGDRSRHQVIVPLKLKMYMFDMSEDGYYVFNFSLEDYPKEPHYFVTQLSDKILSNGERMVPSSFQFSLGL